MFVICYYLLRFKIGPFVHRTGKAASGTVCLYLVPGCFLLGQPGVPSPVLQCWQHFDRVVVPSVVGPVSADNGVPQRAGPSGERDAVSEVEAPGPRFKTVSSKFDFEPFNIGASALVGVFIQLCLS